MPKVLHAWEENEVWGIHLEFHNPLPTTKPLASYCKICISFILLPLSSHAGNIFTLQHDLKVLDLLNFCLSHPLLHILLKHYRLQSSMNKAYLPRILICELLKHFHCTCIDIRRLWNAMQFINDVFMYPLWTLVDLVDWFVCGHECKSFRHSAVHHSLALDLTILSGLLDSVYSYTASSLSFDAYFVLFCILSTLFFSL